MCGGGRKETIETTGWRAGERDLYRPTGGAQKKKGRNRGRSGRARKARGRG